MDSVRRNRRHQTEKGIIIMIMIRIYKCSDRSMEVRLFRKLWETEQQTDRPTERRSDGLVGKFRFQEDKLWPTWLWLFSYYAIFVYGSIWCSDHHHPFIQSWINNWQILTGTQQISYKTKDYSFFFYKPMNAITMGKEILLIFLFSIMTGQPTDRHDTKPIYGTWGVTLELHFQKHYYYFFEF